VHLRVGARSLAIESDRFSTGADSSLFLTREICLCPMKQPNPF
jgi:hypothetical protein